jgi:DNA-binding transcriptional LysR family regulator
VRVAAPGAFGRRFVAPAAERFLSENPRTSIELVLTDRRGDLVAQAIDLAVRSVLSFLQ